jgi:acetolactate synthase-1/2/3 large subunit
MVPPLHLAPSLIPSVAPTISPSLLPTLAPRFGRDRLESLRAPRPEAFATLADELVSALAAAGITTYFGVPGGAIEPFFNALARGRAEGRLQIVPMRGEAGAAFAADGYYRETGRLAACVVTAGPGISNLITATMSAHADRIPFLIITPQVASHKQGRGALQDSSMDGHDLPRMLASCTRYSTVVTHPEQLGHKLARALSAAYRAPSGPVHLAFPSELLAGQPSQGLARPLSLWASEPKSSVDLVAVGELVDAVLRSRVPVLYVGDDAGPGAARVRHLARALGAAVVSSPAGKRWLGHRDPTYRGVLGFSGHVEAQRAVEASDLIVAFGATFDELSTNAWTALPRVPIYAVDAHSEFAYRLSQARPVLATTEIVIELLLDRLRPPMLPSIAPRFSGLRPARPREEEAAEDGPVHPMRLMSWLSQVLPDDVVVHVDAGNSFSWSTRDLSRSCADTYRVAMGLATMCWAISAVIGAAIGRPRRTLCITGDGSMLMSSLELTVAVEQRLPVTYVVLNDSALGMVRHGQKLSGAEPIAHEVAKVRFDQLAIACGARGLRVERQAELDAIDAAWFDSDDGGPCVIDVRIDRDAVPPMADRVRGLAEGIPR